MEYRRHRFVSVGLWYKTIHTPLASRFIKISKKGTSLSLNYSLVNLIEEFKVSINSSGFTLFLSNCVSQSSKKLLQFCKINSWSSHPHLSLKKSRHTGWLYFAPCLTFYCPVAIMKKFVQLMRYFIGLKVYDDWLIFSSNPSLRKLLAFFLNISERERQKCLQWSLL